MLPNFQSFSVQLLRGTTEVVMQKRMDEAKESDCNEDEELLDAWGGVEDEE